MCVCMCVFERRKRELVSMVIYFNLEMCILCKYFSQACFHSMGAAKEKKNTVDFVNTKNKHFKSQKITFFSSF